MDSTGILKDFIFELNSHCKKRGRTKETLICVTVNFILHPALKHSWFWYCATELCARYAIIKCEWAFIPNTL